MQNRCSTGCIKRYPHGITCSTMFFAFAGTSTIRASLQLEELGVVPVG
jgi:hypothetical protein